MTTITSATAHPFVRYAGGKSRMLDAYRPFLPELTGDYYEPFLGGGAMFFDLMVRTSLLQTHHAWLSDSNPHLINAYRCIRDVPESVIVMLKHHLAMNSKEYYLILRDEFNKGIPIMYERAAAFLYLNHCAFNGLWRVSKTGKYNVGYDASRPNTYDFDNLMRASEALQDVSISHEDFRGIFTIVQPGDFLFVDPPYVTDFTSYTSDKFDREDHHELCEALIRAHLRGAKWLMTCNDVPLIRNLYHTFTIHSIQEPRSINSNGKGRAKVPCVLIQSW